MSIGVGIFLILLGIVVSLAALFGKDAPKIGVPFGLILAALGVVATGYTSIPAGHRGILLRFGAVQGKLGEGFNLIIPFVNQVTEMDVRTKKVVADANGASSDVQMAHTTVAVNYHVNPDKAEVLYQQVGVSYSDVIIAPAVQETVKAAMANYTATELVTKRTAVKDRVDAALSKRLAKYNIIVEPGGVSFTEFGFSKEFTDSIEAAQSAKQKYTAALTEKKTAIAKAEGEAEASRLRAKALSSQTGNKVIASEWIKKWNGEPPLFVGGGGNSSFLDLSALVDMKEAKAAARAKAGAQ